MKQIPLKKGKFAIVDDEDYPILSRFKWRLSAGRATTNLSFDGKGVAHRYFMRNFVMPPKNSYIVINKNKDLLDCRKENLFYGLNPLKTHRGIKQAGQKNRRFTSIYKGVSYVKNRASYKKWRVVVRKDGKDYHSGCFATEKEAGLAYNEKARELYGEYAYQNKI